MSEPNIDELRSRGLTLGPPIHTGMEGSRPSARHRLVSTLALLAIGGVFAIWTFVSLTTMAIPLLLTDDAVTVEYTLGYESTPRVGRAVWDPGEDNGFVVIELPDARSRWWVLDRESGDLFSPNSPDRRLGILVMNRDQVPGIAWDDPKLEGSVTRTVHADGVSFGRAGMTARVTWR